MEAVGPGTGGTLFRLMVENNGHQRGTFFAQVVEIDGTTTHGPEAPYNMHWRGNGMDGFTSLAPDGGREMLDVAEAPIVPADEARPMGLEGWYPPWHVYSATGAVRFNHPVPMSNVTTPDHVLVRPITLTIRILHEEHTKRSLRSPYAFSTKKLTSGRNRG